MSKNKDTMLIETDHRNLYAVVYGNIIDGYGHYGPFWDFNDAQEWAERNTADENTWNIVVLRGA